MCCIIGLSATGARGFGIAPVSGKSLVPLPAARTIAFIEVPASPSKKVLRVVGIGQRPKFRTYRNLYPPLIPAAGRVTRGAAGEPPAHTAHLHPQEPLHVLQSRGGDVHPTVEVLDPVHWHFAYAVAPLLCQQKQLGVEEPLVVLDLRQELAGGTAFDRLEAALGSEKPLRKRVLIRRL